MAITPRTILSRPLNLLLFTLGVLGVGGFVGLLASAGGPEASEADARVEPAPTVGGVDAGEAADDAHPALNDQPTSVGWNQDYTCRLEQPTDAWTEAQWLRHIDCMDARGEPDKALLEETRAAVEAVGLTADLALLEADYLKVVGTPQEHLDFLDEAVDQIGVVDGALVHRLSRALAWRADPADIERIRHLQLLSRTLMGDDCEVLQTDIWVRYLMAEELAARPSPAAHRGVQDAVASYLARGCHQQRHTGEWYALAEIVGVGVAAELANGHDGHSSLIRRVAESFHIRQVGAFCRQAVPDTDGLREYCKKRVDDELFLSRP